MKMLVDQYKDRGFSDFRGLHIDARIPITERVLNEAVQKILVTGNDSVQHARITIRDQNTLEVELGVRWGPLAKTLRFDARVGKDIDFETTRKLTISLTGSGLPLGLLARIADSVIGVLPEGVRVVGKVIEVDIGTMLNDRGLGYLIPMVKLMRIETVPGELIAYLTVEVS